MNILDKTELVLALTVALPVIYLLAYMSLRMAGFLKVNRHGWQAGGIHLGRSVVLPAMWLFAFYQPFLRVESGLARFLNGTGDKAKRDQTVSDVVVEIIPLA